MENQESFQEASKHYYGAQNKYTDKLDFYDKQEEDLNNNLIYFNTYLATGSYIIISENKYHSDVALTSDVYSPIYSKNSKYAKKFNLKHTSNYTHTNHTIDTDFIKNIKIKNLSGEYKIIFSMSNQLIYILYSDIYNVVVKKTQISNNKDFVNIPIDNIPCSDSPHHLAEILIYSSENIENIEVFYDIYKYDSIKDPMKIIDNTFFKLIRLIKRVRYIGVESIGNNHRMNYESSINSIAVNISEKFDKLASLHLDNKYILKLTPSYRVGDFVIYDFPCINFSRIDRCMFVIDDKNFTCENFKMFVFDVQPIHSMSGRTGMVFDV